MTQTDDRIDGERLRRALARDAQLAAKERAERHAMRLAVFVLLAAALLVWCSWGPLP